MGMRIVFTDETERQRFVSFCQTETLRNQRIAEALERKKAIRPSERAMGLAECATRIDRYRQMAQAATLREVTGANLYADYRDQLRAAWNCETDEFAKLESSDQDAWNFVAKRLNGDA